LGIIVALQKFHVHLYGRKFNLFTDHKALLAIATKEELSYVMANWLDVLSQYDFDLYHRPGVLMVLPDRISRMYVSMRTHRTELDAIETTATDSKVRRIKLDELTQHPDRELREFIQERLNKELVSDGQKQQEVIARVHSAGHFGAEKMFKQIWNEGYYWPGLRKACGVAVEHCRGCLQYNIGKEGFLPLKSLRAQDPWDHIAVDCAVNLPESRRGNRHILILVDVASRFVVTTPLKSMDMDQLAEKFYMIFCAFGPPKIMQSDNGTEFVNQLVEALLKAANVDHRLVAPWNPRANGLAERTVGNVKLVLKKKLEGMLDRWDEALPGVTHAINTTESRQFKATPFSLFFGRPANSWKDYRLTELQDCRFEVPNAESEREEDKKLMEEVIVPAVRIAAEQRQDHQNAKLDKKRVRAPKFEVGCKVMVKDNQRSSKLEPLWLGPFEILRKNKRGTFQVKDLSGAILHRTIPVTQMKLCGAGPLFGGDGSALGANDDEQKRYVVQSIIDDRVNDQGLTEVLVRWRGYGEADDTWEKVSSFDDGATLANYWRRKQNKKRARSAVTCQNDGSFSALTCTANACASTEVANSNKSGTGSISGSTGAVVSVTCNARPKPKKTLSKKRRKKSNVG
jgi:hypothetical protein